MKRAFYIVTCALLGLMLQACSVLGPVQQDNQSVAVLSATDSNLTKQEPLVLDRAFVSLDELPSIPTLSVKYVDQKEVKCLAETAYYEARGEGAKGMAAVMHVVVNRSKDSRFPSTMCGVVYQGKYVKGKIVAGRCEFSWVCDGKPNVIKDKKLYEQAMDIARGVLLEEVANPVGQSLFFHNVNVKARWSKKYLAKYKLGRHVFYA